MASEKHALVLGASGISGWSLVYQALSYPTPTTFKSITGQTNRPLSVQEARLPNDPRISLVSGIDFSRSESEVKSILSSKIPNLSAVTHVFFTAYVAKATYAELVSVNSHFCQVALSSLSSLCPALESVILQTGGKAYGLEFADKVEIKTPLMESAPRAPKPYADNIFYYPQYDITKSLSDSAKWTFTEVRPDVIVGFVPNDNAMDGARGIALYLTLYRHIHGEGAEAPFFGTEKSWINKHNDTFQDILARFEIYAALHPGSCGKGAQFNIADGPVVSWSEKWPALCKYFGLKGVGPKAGTLSAPEFAKKNGGRWKEVESNHGLRKGLFERYAWSFVDGIAVGFDFDREYDLSRARLAGFTEEIDTIKAWTITFDRLKDAKVIP